MLNEEVALAELEIYKTKLEELDLEAALNFATAHSATPLRFGISAQATKNRGFKESYFQMD